MVENINDIIKEVILLSIIKKLYTTEYYQCRYNTTLNASVNTTYICNSNILKFYDVTCDSLYYFVIISDVTSVLKQTPDSYTLNHLLMDIDYEWYNIGLCLRVDRTFLKSLKDLQICKYSKLKKVIESWKDTKPSPVTWETVIDAIESPFVNNKEIANRIRQKLKYSK